jgi:polysaccharide deacetylase 2 family uncharacterized protein YibQ
MAGPNRNKSRNQSSGSRVAALVIAVLILGVIAGYFLFSPSKKTDVTTQKPDLSRVKPVTPATTTPIQKSVGIAEPTAVSPPTEKEEKASPPKTSTPEADKPGVAAGTSARLAIIIDDMGNSMSEARSLAAIKVPLTFSIIPGLRVDKEVAAYAGSRDIETMIHIPMQSKGWPSRRLEANGLLVSMDADDLQKRVSGFVQQFPGAVGVNNHMGSEFTEQEEKMTPVLQILKKNNLFFIDSVTSPESVGLRVAQRMGIRSARRNVFLDNEQERSYILGQLNQAVRLARKNGAAIAICHPHPATIATLAAALPELATQGVRFVPASQLVK